MASFLHTRGLLALQGLLHSAMHVFFFFLASSSPRLGHGDGVTSCLKILCRNGLAEDGATASCMLKLV